MQLQIKTLQKLRVLINEDTEYRSGPSLVKFFNSLGFNDKYKSGFPSRWIYTDGNLELINGTEKLKECILKIFNPIEYIDKFEELDKFIEQFNNYMEFDGYKIDRQNKRIIIINIEEPYPFFNEEEMYDEFLQKEFDEIELKKLHLDKEVTAVLKIRIEEIKKCISSRAALALIFLAGSALEGILLGVAQNNPKQFIRSKYAFKDKEGKILPFQNWSLNSLINTAADINLIEEDVKKYSHTLRDFRNYIHPYQQVRSHFNPSEHTAKISWQVLKAAIFQISNSNNN